MKAISTALKDRLIIGSTVFSGAMFATCIWIIASDYQPLVADVEVGKNLNRQLYQGMVENVTSIKNQLDMVASSFYYSPGQAPSCSVDAHDMARALESAINFGQTLLVRNP